MASLRACFGTDEPVPPTLTLAAGPLSVRLRGTRIVGVHANGHEVWHGLAFLHRDRHWGTPEPVVESLRHWRVGDGFHAEIDAVIPAACAIDLHITIDADGEGHLRYAGRATPRDDLDTNRTGLCLLHPQDLAGHAIELLHDDGRTSASTFPYLIAPWPPFMNLRGIAHAFGDGGWAEARFEGDVFEFEDQRNNADASFKTYNRSNLMPRPYRLRAGQPVQQSVALRVVRPLRAPAAVPVPPAVRRGAEPLKLGIAIAPADAKASDAHQRALGALRPAFVHLALAASDSQFDAAGLALLCDSARAPLRLDITGLQEPTARESLQAIANALAARRVPMDAVAVFPSTPPIVAAARAAFPGLAIGGGTPWFFVQLNRIEDLGAVDFLCFSTSALVHGSDDESVMAGLASLPAMAHTLAARHPGLPVRIGPSAIAAPRGSPLGAQPPSDGSRRMALAARDPRARALFGAAWLVGYLARCAEAGFETATAVQLSGADGLVDAGQPCPAALALARLAGPVCRPPPAAPVDPPSLAVVHGMRGRLLANLGDEPQSIALAPGETLDLIDARDSLGWRRHGGSAPPQLGAYAIGWIESHPRPHQQPGS